MQDRGGNSHQIAWNAVVADDVLQAVGRDVTAETAGSGRSGEGGRSPAAVAEDGGASAS